MHQAVSCTGTQSIAVCCATVVPGNAYAARKNSPDKSWQQAAYTDEIAHLVEDQPVHVAAGTAVQAA